MIIILKTGGGDRYAILALYESPLKYLEALFIVYLQVFLKITHSHNFSFTPVSLTEYQYQL